ncbi:MAG: hypothetical protein U0M08_04425 [Clostridia bacterium]|nr:hypothetical protein [Clostridia bacterium]
MINDRYKLCKVSQLLLHIGLTLIFALILYIGFLLETAANSPEGILYITLRCRVMLDYALLTTVILIGGSLFVDCVIKGKIK